MVMVRRGLPVLAIDVYERPQQFIEDLRAVFPEEATCVEPLREGDYHVRFEGLEVLPVERKTANDLLSSMTTRAKGDLNESRLENQLRRCMEKYGRVILLQEGMIWPSFDPGYCVAGNKPRHIPYVAVQAMLLKVQRELGAKYLITVDREATIQTLHWLHGYVQRKRL